MPKLKIGRVLKGIGKGLIHDVLPVPDLGRILRDPEKKTIADEIRKKANLAKDPNVRIDRQDAGIPWRAIADMLDDGKINDSPNDKKIETVTRAITSVSGLIGILVYLISVWL